MGVSLKKGQGVSLKKSDYDLSMVTIGLGWDVYEKKVGFLGGLLAKKEEEQALVLLDAFCLPGLCSLANLAI